MKKIISGKVYDTETAQKVGYWSNNLGYRDFNWREESLYRKKTGEYFLHGAGGPRTNYAERVGNMWGSGERIMPLTFTEAKAWAEEHLDGEEYEEIFGEVAEDGSRIQVCYSLAASTVETIKRRAAEGGISASEYVDRLVSGS